jgi:quercetin dioxygenase-like cupin family protein
MKILLSSFVAVAVSVGIVRWIPSPERSAHAFDDPFGVSSDKDVTQMWILSANEDRVIVEETQGKNCVADDFDGMCSPPYHYHTFQSETFEVMEGAMRLKLNGKEFVLGKGESATIPPGDKHTFIKSGSEILRSRITLFPNPDNTERFFPNLFGTIRDAGPNPVQIIYLFCNNGVRLVDITGFLHEALCVIMNVMAPLAGYRLEYPEYQYKGEYTWEEESTESEKEQEQEL